MQLPILLDRDRDETLTAQLIDRLRDAIAQRRLVAGARLPSSRQLAEQLGVSRNTVIRAYDELQLLGCIEARPASGVYVTDIPRPAALPRTEVSTTASMPPPRLALVPREPLEPAAGRMTADFFPARPAAGLFPMKTWRRLMQQCLSRGGPGGLTHYGDPAGQSGLRSAIAQHLAASRGLVADPAQILIVNGIQQGLDLTARLLLGPGLRAALEDPCYQGALAAFRATGAAITQVAVDEDGVDADALPAQPTALVHLTPSHQFPTGHAMSVARREAAIGWARRQGCYLVEDDYDGDFRYEATPLPALAALGPDCTIHLGSFSRSLGAGLRVGYMVVPQRLADAARALKALSDNGSSWLEQAVLARFIETGGLAAHLMRVRAQYRENRDCLLETLRRHFGDIAVSGQESGLHFLWRLPAGVPDAARLEAIARQARVGIYGIARAGAVSARASALTRRAIVLGYASLTQRQIEQGIGRLSEAIDETLERNPAEADAWMAPDPAAPSWKRPGGPVPSFRQRPALRRPAPRRAPSVQDEQDKGRPMAIVKGLYRYPVKGLDAQPLRGVALEAGKPFPFDRIMALARPGAPIDPDRPKWAKKGLFVMLMLDEALATVRTHLDVETMELTIIEAGTERLRADLNTRTGRTAAEQFFHALMPGLKAEPRLMQARDGHFMDKPDNVLSLINLATVRHLEKQWGVRIDPLRFRANIYIDGPAAWEEFAWIGEDIRIGEAVFRVDRRNGRCGATNVNPRTGRRDMDIPSSLRAAYGHKDLGVYLATTRGGTVVVGDTVHLPHGRVAVEPVQQALEDGRRRFICRGCYFIYDEATASPPMPFADLPAHWRCPDCGTDATTFRPYVPMRSSAMA